MPTSPPASNSSSPAAKGQAEDKSYFASPPALSLPKGGGAIKGMGEKFAANPVTGTGTMSVPIAVTPGRAGFTPQLALAYDSGSGNGIFGMGWSLALPTITRKTDKGLPRYQDVEESDVFILSGAEDLVPVLTADGKFDEIERDGYRIRKYRPRIEGLFARIERWTKLDVGETHWRSISKDNITTIYGRTSQSRIADPEQADRVFSWLICESYDDKGNLIYYQYQSEDNQNSVGIDRSPAHERNRTPKSRSSNRYPKHIYYGNQTPRQANEDPRARQDWLFEVVFDYGEHDSLAPIPKEPEQWTTETLRPDPFSSYRSGFEVRTYRLCRRVLMFHHFPKETEVGQDCLVRSTDFSYSNDKKLIYSFIESVTQTGYKRKPGGGYNAKSLPKLEFTYSKPIIDERVWDVDAQSLENLPQGLDGTRYQWVDLNGEGLSGILTEQGNGWFYKRNLSPINPTQADERRVEAKFAAVAVVATKPASGLATGAQFLDLAGDGQPDVVTLRGATPGFYERTQDEEWESFVPFTSFPNLDWDDPNLKFIDLDGDGHSDILIRSGDCFKWHPSLAEAGFGAAERVFQPWDEEQGARVVFADGTQSIYLADMSGDGLTDIVRIRNGEVCYWPNLGYGRFGAKVTMDDAPWFDRSDIFNQNRIVLADIDGSGTTDILYLSAQGVQVYFNQSGNSWATKRVLQSFPAIDSAVAVTTLDLLGNGTACLVWSSPLPGHLPAMRYIDLMGGQKPHLLVKTVNNLGAETVVEYAPSTKFYLQDDRDGKPWITKLPFPVHVVEKVTVRDKWRQTEFSSTYSYHHGYFDGVEREFRGFGRVEQTDVEDFGTFAAGNVDSPYISADRTLYQPPVKTITWFHTGAFIVGEASAVRNRDRILAQFQTEYFAPSAADFAEHRLPEPTFADADLSAQEWREALRACKGMMLRQETYELDVDALARGQERRVKLFSTAFHNCQIQRLQPQGKNRHAVFLVTENEAITYHYELDLRTASQPDPRIAHTLNLRIDEYGNVLESVAIAYSRSRRDRELNLDPDTIDLITEVQQERHVVYTQNRLTNDAIAPDAYRLRVPCEVKTYELTGITPSTGLYFTLAELRSAQIGSAIAEIPYQGLPDRRSPQRRLVEWVRMLYFAADLQTPLPWGTIDSLGLPYETYKLALTKDLLETVFGDKLTATDRQILDRSTVSGYFSGNDLAARFPDLDTSDRYWIRSGTAGFEPDAAAHFYLPERYTDPFGNVTTLKYDPRDLYIQSSTDALGNTTEVTQFDFRVLAPRQMKDANDNRSAVWFDVLGMPVAMAVQGKGTEGDNLTGFTDELANLGINELVPFFGGQTYNETTARIWLGNATIRYIYYFGEVENPDRSIQWGVNPACACGIVRERHVAALTNSDRSPLQVSFEYSDGGGNVLVKKVQAEPEQLGGALRWIASGKTMLNNKGKPVKQYEPYFTASHQFEEPQAVGVTPVMYYDAVGRLVRTELPDGTFSRVEFSPWQVKSFDANDTVLESGWYQQQGRDRFDPTRPLPTDITGQPIASPEARSGWLAAQHANTPAATFLDSLGREVVAISHNRTNGADEKYVTYTKLDAEGKPLWIRDARGNLVMQYVLPYGADDRTAPPNYAPCYDIAGNLLFQHGMDGGDRWMLMDAIGKPMLAWDDYQSEDTPTATVERRRYRTEYDALHRPVSQRLQIDGGTEQTIEQFVYGEGLTDAKARNLRGQVYQHYDAGGVVTNQRFDFKGNLQEVTRQLTQTYDLPIIDWAIETPSSEVFTQRTEYDALNRMTLQENWHRTGSVPAIYTPEYNRRGLLVGETLSVRGQATAAIVNIEYDAKGQQTRIQYGNGTTTRYTYDPQTFRLVQLRTTRTSPGENLPIAPSNLSDPNVYQNLYYTYDPVGNITEILDDAYEPIFFNNQMVEPRSRYTYDALYRLIAASGREQAGANAAPPQREDPLWPEVNFPVTDRALRNYTQFYEYDSVGNMLAMRHIADRGNWTRSYEYASNSNRLIRTNADNPNKQVDYQYDSHGSMLNLDRVPDEYHLQWDYRDTIHLINLGGGGRAVYNYDASKQRTRKRIERNNGGNTVEERLYLGGMELYRRWLNGNLVEEIETHHLFAGDRRVSIVEDVISTDNSNLPTGVLFRYQYSNHLGSVGLEVNGDGAIVSYEEYHPYGTTAYRSVNRSVRSTAKRYRYTGMERDEESGLSYHTARYYLPWLGRWGSVDPIGIGDGLNLFSYARNNPISLRDLHGLQAEPERDNGSNPSGQNANTLQNAIEVAKKEVETIKESQKIIKQEKNTVTKLEKEIKATISTIENTNSSIDLQEKNLEQQEALYLKLDPKSKEATRSSREIERSKSTIVASKTKAEKANKDLIDKDQRLNAANENIAAQNTIITSIGKTLEEARQELTKLETESVLANPKVKAFLNTIAWAEGGAYDKRFGGATFSDLSTHPGSVKIKGTSYSAAGRYQITKDTWEEFSKKLGLKDFSQDSQDLIATKILLDLGVDKLLDKGNLEMALKKASGRWAALPKGTEPNPAKQHDKPFKEVEKFYNSRLAPTIELPQLR